MQYIPVIEALEDQLKKSPQLKELRYYRFSIPTSSVKSPFICIPFSQTLEYTSHVNSCIVDTITNSCVGNFFDEHRVELTMLIGAARHGAKDVHEVLDMLQHLVVEQLKADRYLNDAVRFSEVDDMKIDNFAEITPNHLGAILKVNIKYIDIQPEVSLDENWIQYLLGPEVEEG